MKEFRLPDLGEGLTEAEIVEWHVSANQDIKLNEPLLSVETDKAVVEVPSPVSARVLSLHGDPGDVIPVGNILVRFDTGKGDGASPPPPPLERGLPALDEGGDALAPSAEGEDALAPTFEGGAALAPTADGKDQTPGVVGELPASGLVLSDTTQAGPAAPRRKRVKAAPSVRALARELGVDLTQIEGSGPQGRITAKDVARAAQAASRQSGPPPAERAPPPRERGLPALDEGRDALAPTSEGRDALAPTSEGRDALAPTSEGRDALAPTSEGRDALAPTSEGRDALAPSTGQDALGPSAAGPAPGTEEKLSGPRRSMFRSMTAAHSEVALCTVMDDADIHDWESPRDFTPRLIRAMVAGCRAKPRLNGTFSAETGVLSLAAAVHMGLAMHTPHGLIVAAIRNADKLGLDALRGEVARLKQAGVERTLKPDEVRGYTITLSNIAGGSSRYATPLMVPPTVAILGSGAAREEVVAVNGEIAIRRMLPLSLTFDHRCVAGVDASRFLSAVVADLKLAS